MSEASSQVVLHVRVVTGVGGGPEKTILNTPRFYAGTGYQGVCVYLHPPGDPGVESLQARAKETGAELIAIPDRGLTDFSVVSRLLQLCRERQVTIWHGHDYKSDALGLLVRRFHSMKLVTTVHGWINESSRAALYQRIDLKCLKHYDRIVCVSEPLLAECIEAGIPIDKLSLIENGIVLEDYACAHQRTTGEDSAPLIGAIGRLSPEKGFDVLIRAVDQLLETGLQTRLVIAGEGPLKNDLQKLINDLDRADSIQLLGHVSDPRSLLSQLSAFVLSSRYEGLPNVLLEALASRVPVVATAVGGVPRVVTHEHDALLVPIENVDALTIALTRLLHNDALQQQLAENGYCTVAGRYGFDLRMQKFVAIYDTLLGRQSAALKWPEFDAQNPANESGSQGVGTNTPNGGDHLVSPTPLGINASSDGGAAVPSAETAVLNASQPLPSNVRPRATERVVAREHIQVELTTTPECWHDYLVSKGHAGFYQRANWLHVLRDGLQHQPVCLQATVGRRLVGVLPLAQVDSPLFGNFLVSLPYVNSSGIVADSPDVEFALADRAIELADQLEVRYLELRHERAVEHPKLKQAVTDKVHMRLQLPATSDALWDAIKAKVRNQIRKAQKNEGFSIHWGGHDILDEFYEVFCKNMRDLGTPPFGRSLFAALVNHFPGDAEFCCVRLEGQPVASGLLIHGPGSTEVPSASSLRAFNSTNCNMLLYWNLLTRTVERGQRTFDFGRSSRDSGTYAFKSQWGATESPAVWQHYVRQGDARDMRPNNGKFDLMIRAWQKLPVWVTKLIGPNIVRGIP